MDKRMSKCSLLATLLILSLPILCFGQVPQSRHVFIVVEENENYIQAIDNPDLPYLNSLANRYGLATNYFANGHPSVADYFMLTTGQLLTTDDNVTPATFPVSADNIVRELLAAGKTWKSYCEDIPSVGYLGGNSGNYEVSHCPLPYMTDVQSDTTQRQNLVPFTQFAQDLANNQLPNFSFIVPNRCNDAHDCPLSTADAWLHTNIDPLIQSTVFQQDGILVIVFDESVSGSVSADNEHGGGQVLWVVVGPQVKNSFQSANFYQHENTLRMLCEALGLRNCPGAAATAADMAEFFVPDTTPTSGNTCNGVYRGTFNGSLTVSVGQECIFLNGGVTGNVVQNGGNLMLIHSYVGGDVQINGGGTFTIGPGVTMGGNLQIQHLPSGAAQNQVCGSNVHGDLQFHHNGTAVLIGAAGATLCAGNTVGGNLEIQNNWAATTLVGNTVTGNLEDHNNTGPTQVFSNLVGNNLQCHNNSAATTLVGNTVTGNLEDHNNTGPTQVFSNLVGNNLQCQKNSSITGGGNTAKSKQGQCWAF